MVYILPLVSVTCVLFGQAIIDCDGDGEADVLDITIVLLWLLVPDIEVTLTLSLEELDDVDELAGDILMAAT